MFLLDAAGGRTRALERAGSSKQATACSKRQSLRRAVEMASLQEGGDRRYLWGPAVQCAAQALARGSPYPEGRLVVQNQGVLAAFYSGCDLMFLHLGVASLPSSVTQGACLLGFCHPNHWQLKRVLYAELGENVRRFLALSQRKASYLLVSSAQVGCTSDLKLLNFSPLTAQRDPLVLVCASAERCPDDVSTIALLRLWVRRLCFC